MRTYLKNNSKRTNYVLQLYYLTISIECHIIMATVSSSRVCFARWKLSSECEHLTSMQTKPEDILHWVFASVSHTIGIFCLIWWVNVHYWFSPSVHENFSIWIQKSNKLHIFGPNEPEMRQGKMRQQRLSNPYLKSLQLEVVFFFVFNICIHIMCSLGMKSKWKHEIYLCVRHIAWT